MKVNFERTRATTVFEALRSFGHDEDFEGVISDGFAPTDATPGSAQKIETMRRRAELGQPLYHEDDCPFDQGSQQWELPVVSTELWDRAKKGGHD